MVDSVANVLLEALRDLLIEEVELLSGVRHEVKKVEAIHGLLMDADINRGQNNNSHTLRNELKELALRAENVLETYALEVESKREGKSLKKKLQRYMCECESVHEVGKEMDDIRSSLSDLTTRLSSIAGGGEGSSASAEAFVEAHTRWISILWVWRMTFIPWWRKIQNHLFPYVGWVVSPGRFITTKTFNTTSLVELGFA